MSDVEILSAEEFGPQNAERLVILLHGYGSDGKDLIDLAQPLSTFIPNTYFISPNAPEPCEINPYGYQWFSLENREENAMRMGADLAASKLNAFIDQQLDRFQIDENQLALVGFSQGSMMAFHVAPRRPKACVGVVGFSGRLIDQRYFKEHPDDYVKPPIQIIHGDYDDVVPVAEAEIANQGFKKAGFDVKVMIRPMLGHGIDPDGLRCCGSFLAEKFDEKAVKPVV